MHPADRAPICFFFYSLFRFLASFLTIVVGVITSMLNDGAFKNGQLRHDSAKMRSDMQDHSLDISTALVDSSLVDYCCFCSASSMLLTRPVMVIATRFKI